MVAAGVCGASIAAETLVEAALQPHRWSTRNIKIKDGAASEMNKVKGGKSVSNVADKKADMSNSLDKKLIC